MTLKTSLVLAGESSGAEAALASVDKGLTEASAEAKRLADAMDEADKSIDKLAAAQSRAKTATAAAKAEFAAGEITQREYNSRLLETKTGLALFEAGHRNAVTALKQAQGALAGAKVSSGQAAAGYQNFGRQVQDVAVQLQGGANIGTIIAQQGGQIADAVAQMGGRFSGLASFLAGPWGAALIIGTGLLVDLGMELLSTGDAADDADGKARDFSKGLNVLELSALSTRDAVKALADEMRAAISVQGDFTRAKAQAAQQSVRDIETRLAQNEAALRAETSKSGLMAMIPFAGPDYRKIGSLREEIRLGREALAIARQGATDSIITEAQNRVLEGLDKRTAATNEYRRAVGSLQRQLEMSQSDPIGAAAAGTYITPAQYEQRFRDLTARKDAEIEAAEKANRQGRTRRSPADRTAARAEYGEDIGKRIANITDQFSEMPSAVVRAQKALRELNDISTDLAARPLTPNVKDLIEEIGKAKAAINDSLNKPFNDFMEKAAEAAEIDKLLLQGREDEAAALRIVLDMQRQQKPLQEGQLQAVLETVQAQRQMDLVLRDQRELIDANINAVRDFRAALTGTVADALRGRLSVERILASIGNSYVNIVSQKVVERLFGDTLRKLEAQATGADKVDAAGNRIATSLDKGGKAVEDFAAVVARASATIDGGGTGGSSVGSLAEVASGAAGSLGGFFDKITSGLAEKVAQRASGGVPEATGDEIVVTASKGKKVDLSGTASLLFGMVEKTVGDLGLRIPAGVSQSIKDALGRLEQSLPQALQGAFTGGAASRIILGDKGVGGSIGSAIGGALGGKIGEQVLTKGLTAIGGKALGSLAGPLGSALGGVLGGLIGGAFKTVKSGGASIGLNAQGQAGVTGTAGNSADLKKTASGYAGTVVSALDQIAQALGADLGNFSVAIGKRSSGYIKVDSTGNAAATTAKKRGANIIYDGKDEGEAIMAALANAISDGAIAGVSAAVQKALKSSTDVDKAVKEALKVQQVELAIGGIGAEMEKAFKDFERQAAERLRIARQYGFDVTKLEAVNAKDRLKLSERLLKEQVGSLQDLITELTSGSLFEGSAVDLRAKLLEQIATVRSQAAAGEEGAADKLSQLLQQLNTVSRDAFGTTGGFAADRSTILDAARESVAAANKRIEDAQKASTSAAQETNTQLDEANDQLARIAASLGVSVQYLQKMSQNWTFVGFDKLAAQAGFR